MRFHEEAEEAVSRAEVLSCNCIPMTPEAHKHPGFTLIEMLFALLVLSTGLLAMGQLIFAALSCASLARSKANAAIAAQDKLEFLGSLCQRDPADQDLTSGIHDGDVVQFTSDGGVVLNRFRVSWIVSELEDPRGGIVLPAKLIRVAASPVDMDGNRNDRVLLNKTVEVVSVFYTGTP
jgi:prepilin-type N-terminal cleavage/methylation domain-containing protein